MISTIRRVLAAAAVLALPLAVATAAVPAQASVRPAATAACGSNCIDISSLELGTSQVVNAYVPGDLGTGAKAGQRVNLHYATDTQVNEDITGGKVGTVSQFCASAASPQGLLSSTSYACLNYPGDPVYEADVSPFGNSTGLCAGLALPEHAGENVTLRPCGQDAGTLWIGDTANSHCVGGTWYTPLVSAGFTGFSHPLALTVEAGTKRPANQLSAEPENLLTGGYVANDQMWTGQDGPAL